MRRWELDDLRKLAKARKREDLTFPQTQARYFPARSVSAVRSATRTKKYKEVAREIESREGVITAGEGPESFRFPGIDLTLDRDTFASLVRSYVDAGAGKTRAQVARQHGLTEEQMDHICRVYGLTKDSPPVPLEILASISDEEVVEATLNARAEGVKQRVEDSRAKYFERKYRKLLKQHQNRECVLARLDEWVSKRAARFGATDVDVEVDTLEVHAVHAPMADVHLGNQSWHMEVGSDYDVHIGAERVMKCGAWQAEQIKQAGGAEYVYATDIGDFFHAILSQTESGTALDKDTRDLKVFDMAFEAKVHQIDNLRRVSDCVVVMGVPGNHDHIFVPLFNRMLKQHYRHVNDVHVVDVYGKYTGFVVGHTAHLLDHGTGVGKLTGWKIKAQLTAVEKQALSPEDRKHVTDRVYYCGHKHSLQVDTFTEMELRRLPALAEPDEYSVGLRYDSRPGAELYFLDSGGRIARIHRFYPS